MYRYDTGTDNWDSSEKNRSPAWCDRILYKGDNVIQVDYTSQFQYKLSDHKPISSSFDLKVKVINQARYRKCYEECLKQLDRLENEFLPQVTVDIPNPNIVPHSNRNEIHFGRIRFLEPGIYIFIQVKANIYFTCVLMHLIFHSPKILHGCQYRAGSCSTGIYQKAQR